MKNTKQKKQKQINWLKYKPFYFALSTLMLIVSATSLLLWGINKGVDFTGGVNIEYSSSPFSFESVQNKAQKEEINISSIQSAGETNYVFKLKEISPQKKEKLKEIIKEETKEEAIEVRFESVGPSIGQELINKTITAIAFASIIILLWVAFQFKSPNFGASAILAMLHDSFILIGTFSILGHFANFEVDFLFVTALLTTLSFSVHDTIVVFDRIRELKKVRGGDITNISNQALTETMRRSINNSATIALMLLFLLLLGGESIKQFALALLVGTILGTYSSPFVATPLLIISTNLSKKFKKPF
jgi:preprotein translocase subunit SecF